MSKIQKTNAARAALEHVSDGMRLGIGTGSTAAEFIRLLGERVGAGLQIIGVGTSRATEDMCRSLDIPLATLDEMPRLDLTVDGADELDNELRLIKGGGGALLREKIVASASARMIVIADESKLVPVLGDYGLPIEIVPFGQKATLLAIQRLAASLGLREKVEVRRSDGTELVTDNGNLIADASFGRIRDTLALANGLAAIPGVVEHGLFLGMAELAYIGTDTGAYPVSAKI